MRIPRFAQVLTLTGAALALALASCNGSDDRPSPSPTPTRSTTPTVVSTPTPSPSTVQEQGAHDAVLAYVEVVDRLGADPAADIEELHTVATGQALAQMQYTITQYRVDGWRQVGRQVPAFVSATPGSSALEWTITMCVDEREVDMLDDAGNSVKNPDAMPYLLIDYGAVESLAAGQWYVASVQVTDSC